MTRRDVIIVGGGHNGLVCAAFLAKAGLKTLVLERADRVGGCARTSDLAPGFRCPTLSHAATIDSAIVRALGLEHHGLRTLVPEADICAPVVDGPALTLWRDPARAVQEIRAVSPADADAYPRFLERVSRISRVLHALCAALPPALDGLTVSDLVDSLELLKAARAFRALGKADAYRLLRWLPMAVADLASEWFATEPLRATLAASGILGSFLGPRSAGSTAVLLLLSAGEGRPIAPGWFARGGTGAVADALSAAARQAGAELRCGVEVTGIRVTSGRATGVVLSSGEELQGHAVVSNLDPKRTFLGLLDPMHLTPEFTRRVKHIRARGTLAKVNLAVSALPHLKSLKALDNDAQRAAMSGRIRLARNTDAIEHAFDFAKYGAMSPEPWMELTVPSILDPGLAPPGQHVVSAYVQYAPYALRGTSWDMERDTLTNNAVRTIEQYAPGFTASVVAGETITPLDLERTYGLTGGQIFHGELAIDQLFLARPVLGWARYGTPIGGLYLCGAGTHPGTGLNGRSGALAARVVIRDASARRRSW
jgi:phytoene dehydrogenase-like protein